MRSLIFCLLLSSLAFGATPTSKNMLFSHAVVRVDGTASYAAPAFLEYQLTSPWCLNQWVLSGTEALRIEVRSGDIVASGERAELRYPFVFNQGQTVTFDFDVYFDPANNILPAAGGYTNIFQQFHTNQLIGSPNLYFDVDGTGTNLRMQTYSGVAGGTVVNQSANIASYATGTWFTIHGVVLWSPNGDGTVTVTVNGGAPTTITGANLYWSDVGHTKSIGVYPKQGMYRLNTTSATGQPTSLLYETIAKFSY